MEHAGFNALSFVLIGIFFACVNFEGRHQEMINEATSTFITFVFVVSFHLIASFVYIFQGHTLASMVVFMFTCFWSAEVCIGMMSAGDAKKALEKGMVWVERAMAVLILGIFHWFYYPKSVLLGVTLFTLGIVVLLLSLATHYRLETTVEDSIFAKRAKKYKHATVIGVRLLAIMVFVAIWDQLLFAS